MAITLKIAGVDRTDSLGINSGRISGNLNGQYRFSAVLKDHGTRIYRPQKGASILIESAGVKKFAGHIMRVRESDPDWTGEVEYAIECVDHNHIAARRLFSGDFENQSLYSIVAAIVAGGLSGEGVTITGVENPGPTIVERLKFNYETVKQCFDKLSTITGRLWSIDFDKDLHFGLFTSNPAPFEITDTSSNYDGLEIERDNAAYRNRQYVRTEAQIATTYTDLYTVVQTGQDFIPTVGPVSEMISLTLNGSPLTIAEDVLGDGVAPPGYDLYFSPSWLGLWTYGFAVGNPALGLHLVAGDVISATYRGAARNVVMVEDTDEQAARRALQGGSGIWEAIEEQKNLDQFATLEAIASGRLRQNGTDVITASFITEEDARPGQRVLVSVTKHDINQELLIESVDSSWVAGVQDFFRHSVNCTSVEPVSQPQSYQEKLVEMARIGSTAAEQVEQTDAGARTLSLIYGDTLAVGTDVLDDHPKITVGTDRKFRIASHHANLKTVSTGAAAILVAEYSADKSTWTQFATITIGVGDYESDSTALTVADLPDDVYVRLNVTQIGSVTAGAGLEWKFIGEVV